MILYRKPDIRKSLALNQVSFCYDVPDFDFKGIRGEIAFYIVCGDRLPDHHLKSIYLICLNLCS